MMDSKNILRQLGAQRSAGVRRVAVVLFMLTLNANADLIFFKSVTTNRVIGDGQSHTVIINGNVVSDFDTGNTYTIGRYALNGKKYFFVENTQPRLAVTDGATGRSTVVTWVNTGSDEFGYYLYTYYARGQNSLLAIRPGRSIAFPPRLTVTERAVNELPDGTVITEASGTALFSLTQTQAANNANETLDAAVARLKNNLLSIGYVE